MDHRKCPLCAEIIRKYVTVCPYCNHEISPTAGQSAKTALIIVVLIVIALMAWANVRDNW